MPKDTKQSEGIGQIFTWDQLVSRRQFIGYSSAAAAGLAAAGVLAGGARPARASGSASAGEQGERVVKTLCEMCVWRCGVDARVRDGVVVKLEGNPDHPANRGKLCPRGNAGLQVLYDPDRLKFPLMRVGDRGSGLFRRASWDEALDYTAGEMKRIKEKYGPEAMVFSSTHNLSQPYFENLLRAYGSPNYGTQRSLCFNSMTIANLFTFGQAQPGTDYAHAKYAIFSGRNLAESISNNETQDFVDMVNRGAHVVLLDPRFTKSAAKASEWLPIRPGTDLAFYLAMANVIVREKLYDEKFLQANTVGFEEYAKEVDPYTPEWAEVRTEIPARTIRRIAQEFAAARPNAFVHPGWRTSNFLNSFQTERAMAVLNALIGNWNQPGGLIPSAGEEGGPELGTLPQPAYPPVTAMRLDGVPWKFPLVPLVYGIYQNIRDAVLSGQPYQARGWLVSRQNPVLSLPDRRKTIEALNKLELLAVIDVIPNDTAYYADVILPESSYLERYDPVIATGNRIFLRQPVIEPLYDTRSALMIFKQLGERLGLGEYFPYKNEEELVAAQMKPFAVSLDEFKARGYYDAPPKSEEAEAKPSEAEATVAAELAGAAEPATDTAGAAEAAAGPAASEAVAPEAGAAEHAAAGLTFQTTSGKIEISSALLAQVAGKGVPIWEEPAAPPPGKFYLLTGKVAQHSQMGTQNNRWLHDLFPENPVWIHTSVAARLGVGTGDVVVVESSVGKVRTRAYVTEGIRPDCVFMVPGFGHLSKALRTAYQSGVSDSALHETYADPIAGSSALSQTFVTVSKA
ncbi:MAG: molybdopterin-dependent oxidoreductase [Bacillota bacterium]